MIVTTQRIESSLNDEYSTPGGLVRVMEEVIRKEIPMGCKILEPCCGRDAAIVKELHIMGYGVTANDLYYSGYDYLSHPNPEEKYVVTNPPFGSWDKFIRKAKTHTDKILAIGRLNYLGTAGRYRSGMWENLKHVYVFNRYPDYRQPYRPDGKFSVGMLFTGWFLWDNQYDGEIGLTVIDVSDYVRSKRRKA